MLTTFKKFAIQLLERLGLEGAENWLSLSWVPSWLRNKYALTLIGFLAWMIFFDQNNLFVQGARKSELREANQKKGYYEEEIGKISNDLQELLTDADTKEKFAREKHMMKRDNEEIFIIIEK